METTKELYQHKMEAQMKEWGARLDLLKARADKASADAKIEIHKQVVEMGKLEDAAKKHFEEFKASSVETWNEVKKDVEEKWNSLAASVEATWAKVKS